MYDLTPFTPSEALRASTVARAAADPGILIFSTRLSRPIEDQLAQSAPP